ncbi:MAG: YraN family protein [Coriobacteriales bacterium]
MQSLTVDKEKAEGRKDEEGKEIMEDAMQEAKDIPAAGGDAPGGAQNMARGDVGNPVPAASRDEVSGSHEGEGGAAAQNDDAPAAQAAAGQPCAAGSEQPDTGTGEDGEDMYEKSVSELTTKELGQRGEEAAVRFLERRGFKILERNWVCHYGEADIIALDVEEEALVFIEVKTRRGIQAGLPEEAVTTAKQRRYERIAMSYLVESDWEEEVTIRFDVIGICATDENRALLRHHRGCFNGRNW